MSVGGVVFDMRLSSTPVIILQHLASQPQLHHAIFTISMRARWRRGPNLIRGVDGVQVPFPPLTRS